MTLHCHTKSLGKVQLDRCRIINRTYTKDLLYFVEQLRPRHGVKKNGIHFQGPRGLVLLLNECSIALMESLIGLGLRRQVRGETFKTLSEKSKRKVPSSNFQFKIRLTHKMHFEKAQVSRQLMHDSAGRIRLYYFSIVSFLGNY